MDKNSSKKSMKILNV